MQHKQLIETNQFDFIDNDSIKGIFNYLSPIQLANLAITCQRFKPIASSMPSLSRIQAAFFTQNLASLNRSLKFKFEYIISNLKSINTPSERKNLSDKMYESKELIKKGANIKDNNINVLPYLIHQYIQYLILIDQCDEETIKKQAAELKNFILFLIEYGANVNLTYRSVYPLELSGFSALTYAAKYKDRYPELIAILEEYNNYYLKI